MDRAKAAALEKLDLPRGPIVGLRIIPVDDTGRAGLDADDGPESCHGN
jgi:hypothetical protein